MTAQTNVSLIEAAQAGDHIIMVIKSRGTFQLAPLLKKFYITKLDEGFRNFDIDMSECPAMDSTFLGTLAGLSFSLKKVGGGVLSIYQANERNSESLKNLGIDRLFEIHNETLPLPHDTILSPIDAAPLTKLDANKQSLEAHETLVKADKDNEEKFKDVINLLKEDITNK